MGIYTDCEVCCGNFDKKTIEKRIPIDVDTSAVFSWKHSKNVDKQEIINIIELTKTKYPYLNRLPTFDFHENKNSDVFLILSITMTYEIPHSTSETFVLVERNLSF